MANKVELRDDLMSFRETFKDFADCYTVIGGMACFILMEEAGLEFRATKDIDMILILEDKRKDFGKVFWNYIVEGGYVCEQNKGVKHYYRFVKPKSGYPRQIELFSRRNDFELDRRIVPVHIGEDISSLSAIVLDDDFYGFMMEGRKVVNGISVMEAEYLIPFKMYAWLNNKDARESGRRFVNTDDIDKHKKDVFRLFGIVNPDSKVNTQGAVRRAVERFATEIMRDSFEPRNIGVDIEKADAVEVIKNIFL